jgi:hypothetical protein
VAATLTNNATVRRDIQSGVRAHANMRHLSFVTAASILLNAPMVAQEPASPTAASICTYDTCALRLEQRRVFRGAEPQPLVTLGAWGASSLRPHVAPSDSALAYAGEFDRHYTVGTRARTLGWLGAVVSGVLYARYEDNSDHSDGEVTVLLSTLVLSLGVTTYGGRRMDSAMRGLSRAIWWSNRELSR